MTEQTIRSKLNLIEKFKDLLFNKKNKHQTLKEAYSQKDTILLNEFLPPSGPLMIDSWTQTIDHPNPHLTKQKNFSQYTISQIQPKQENCDKSTIPSPETSNNHMEQNLESNDIIIPIIDIDVLILINHEKLVNYVKKTFEQPGIRFFHHLQDLKFENPTIIVRISASRNLDDKLEAAIQNKKPSRLIFFSENNCFLEKSVTMILLSKGSVPVSDRSIMVPNTQTKINAFTFLYNDQYNEPPFRREDACEAKGIFKISDVFDLIRDNS